MLGSCHYGVTAAPPAAVRFVACQLGVDPGMLAGYGSRAQTRTGHVRQVKAHVGFRSATAADPNRSFRRAIGPSLWVVASTPQP
jgi:hypothetical protein